MIKTSKRYKQKIIKDKTNNKKETMDNQNTLNQFLGIDENTLVTSSYRSSVVVPPGVHSYDFTSSANIARSSSMLKATGGMTLVITGSYSGSAS